MPGGAYRGVGATEHYPELGITFGRIGGRNAKSCGADPLRARHHRAFKQYAQPLRQNTGSLTNKPANAVRPYATTEKAGRIRTGGEDRA